MRTYVFIAGLIAALLWGVLTKSPFPRPVGARSPAHQVPPGLARPGVASSSNSTAPNPVPATSFDWRQVESSDYRQYVANLRAIGCPEQTVRDIVVADVRELYDQKLGQARLSSGDYPYWSSAAATQWAAGHQSKLQALLAEERSVLHELLGHFAVPERPSTVAALSDPRVSSMDAATVQRIREIDRRYQERLAQLLANGGDSNEDDPLGALRQDREDSLNAWLDPQTREDYEIRVSPVAERLRASLADLSVTESEFRDLFRVQAQFERDFPEDPFEFLAIDRQKRRSDAQSRVQAEVRRILGEERFLQLGPNPW